MAEDSVLVSKPDGGSPEEMTTGGERTAVALRQVDNRTIQEIAQVFGDADTATRVSDASGLPVRRMDNFFTNAAIGNLSGVSTINKFGRNPDIDKTAEIIWATGGAKTVHTAAVTIEVISGDGNDTAAGSGAQEITIQYIDNNWAQQSGTIQTNGTSASTETIVNVLRVNRAFVSRSGTYGGNNDGNITVRVESAGVTFVTILAGKGQTETTFYTIPTGNTLAISKVTLAVDSTKTASGELFAVRAADDVTTPFTATKRKLWGVSGIQGAHTEEIVPPFIVVGPADVFLEGASAANDTEVEGSYNGVLYS